MFKYVYEFSLACVMCLLFTSQGVFHLQLCDDAFAGTFLSKIVVG